jgi:hypothetical protein
MLWVRMTILCWVMAIGYQAWSYCQAVQAGELHVPLNVGGSHPLAKLILTRVPMALSYDKHPLLSLRFPVLLGNVTVAVVASTIAACSPNHR